MESILSLVAEWVSVKEMKALHGCLHANLRDGKRTAVCGKNCQMTGEDICGKKKKVLPSEFRLNRDEHPKTKNSTTSERQIGFNGGSAMMSADTCGKKKPICFQVQDDDRESLEMAVTALVSRGSEEILGFCVIERVEAQPRLRTS